jgi:hypothetical protein
MIRVTPIQTGWARMKAAQLPLIENNRTLFKKWQERNL